MKKKIIASFVLVFAGFIATADVTISVSARTVDKSGGAASITVSGTGDWTAVSDASWIVVRSGSSGNGAGTVLFVVSANNTADTRIGHININDNVYTVTQYGHSATISPESVTTDRNGSSGTISIVADAGISWTATPNVDWITVSPDYGTSVGTITYQVAPYPGVVSRSGTLTVAGQTFTVVQTGVDVSLSPEVIKMGSTVDIIQVTVTALAGTSWNVTANDPWISVIDKDHGYGDYVLTLAVNDNPSFMRRTGTVTVGTATLTIVQEGDANAELVITPEHADASPSGAYGNVAVYATPDAPWTAESLTSWLTISEGASGAGNGNIKYVASPNPTLEEREGTIMIMPPVVTPSLDLMKGLVCWIPTQYNIEGNGTRQVTKSFNTKFDGSFYSYLKGEDLEIQESNDMAVSFRFRLDDVETVNRLFALTDVNIGDMYLYITSDGEILFTGVHCTIRGYYPFEANTEYVVVINQSDSDIARLDIGTVGGEMTKIGEATSEMIFNVCAGYARGLSNVKFGYSKLPTEGNLQGGYINNFMLWNRGLTDEEIASLVNLPTTQLEASQPGMPDGVKFNLFPLGGNVIGANEKNDAIKQYGVVATNWTESADRYGIKYRGMANTGTGKIVFDDFGSLFEASYVVNKGNALGHTSGTYSYKKNDYYYYPYPITFTSNENASYCCWIYLDRLPDTAYVTVYSKTITSGRATDCSGKVVNSYYNDNQSLRLLVSSEGCFVVEQNGIAKVFEEVIVPVHQWVFISLVGKDKKSIAIYLDGGEVGNVSSSMSFGWLPPTDAREHRYYSSGSGSDSGSIVPTIIQMTVGGWDGAIDEMVFYNEALSASQIKAIYEAGKPHIVYHTVSQGIQEAKLSETNKVIAAEGGNYWVQLTLAQRVNWEAVENCDWLHVTSDTEGAGSATIAWTADSNPTVTNRWGSMTIGGITYVVEQEGLAAAVMCDQTFFDDVQSDWGSISVYTEGGGQWTAVSNDDWIHIMPGDEEGNGAGDCWFIIDDYALTTQSRTGSITIAGKTVYITQSGYKLSIEPMVADVGSNAGAGEIGVAASIDQVWDVICDCDWIQIISGRTGIGNGTVQYTFTDNTTGETRTGRIIIGGQEYMLTQKTTLPVVATVMGGGTVSGTGDWAQGSKATLIATPATGYVFSHWSGDAVGVTNQVAIIVDTAKNITATFIPESAAEQLAAAKAAQGGFYTRDQIHALEVGNLVLDVDAASGTARVGVQLMETSDLSNPNGWRPVGMTTGNLDVGSDGTVGLNVPATGNAKFFKVVVPQK